MNPTTPYPLFSLTTGYSISYVEISLLETQGRSERSGLVEGVLGEEGIEGWGL